MEKFKQILEDLLKTIAEGHKYENCKISVKQINSGGANYSSYIFLASISSNGKGDLKLFAKIAGMGDKIREVADHIYRNEIFFYTDFIKIYQHLEEKHDVPEEHRLCISKYYGSSTERYHEVLVLEDLVANEFQSFDRFKGVSWEQTVESMGQLAKFHALSFALMKYEPEKFALAKKQFNFTNTKKLYIDCIKNISEKVIEATEDKDKKRISEYIKKTLESEKFSYFYEPIRKEVLIHGDYRPNNLMHKSKDGVCQVVILDLQTIHSGAPVFDLMYFIDFGFDANLRKTHFQATIDCYYTQLCTALQRLKLDPNETYSREDFEYELKEILPFTVLFGLCGLLVLTVDDDAAPRDLEDLGPEDFAFTPNDLYREKLKEFINFYTDIGIIP